MKRYIDPIELKKAIAFSNIVNDGKTLEQIIDETPTADVEEVVRCKDCENWDTSWESQMRKGGHYCQAIDLITYGDFYCESAERREE